MFDNFLMGKRLRKLRLKNDYTLQQVADKIGVTKVSVCGYEHGKRLPSIPMLYNLANIYNCSIDYIIGRDYVDTDNNVILSENELLILKTIKSNEKLKMYLSDDVKRKLKAISTRL